MPDSVLLPGDVVALMYNQSDYARIMEIFGFAEVETLKAFDPDQLATLNAVSAMVA